MAMNQSCYGVRPADDRGDYYVYFAIRHEVGDFQQFARGAVFSTITRDTFAGIMKSLPTIELTRAFDRAVGSWLAMILVNKRESQTLAALRDALLPKLLSGEVRVGEAEVMAGRGA